MVSRWHTLSLGSRSSGVDDFSLCESLPGSSEVKCVCTRVVTTLIPLAKSASGESTTASTVQTFTSIRINPTSLIHSTIRIDTDIQIVLSIRI